MKCPIVIDKNNTHKKMIKKKNETIYTNFLTGNLYDSNDIKFSDENNIKIYE